MSNKSWKNDFWETFPRHQTNDGTWWSQCSTVSVGDVCDDSVCVEVTSHKGKAVVRWRKR